MKIFDIFKNIHENNGKIYTVNDNSAEYKTVLKTIHFIKKYQTPIAAKEIFSF